MAKYIEKQIMIVVQATPKTQPGGVQGALFKSIYQSVIGPLFISQLPNANPPKLTHKKNMILFLLKVFRLHFKIVSLAVLFALKLFELLHIFHH